MFCKNVIAILTGLICITPAFGQVPDNASVSDNLTSTVIRYPLKQACAVCGADNCAIVQSATSATDTPRSASVLSNSLWGNLILSMAYERDPEIQRLVKKLGFLNGTTLVGALGLSGLSLGQGIVGLNVINPSSGIDSVVPDVLGIVAGGSAMGLLGLRALAGHRYSKRLKARQVLIKANVDKLLLQLKTTGDEQAAKPELTALIGSEATGEFFELWTATHPTVHSSIGQLPVAR